MAALHNNSYVPQMHYAPIPEDVERLSVAPGLSVDRNRSCLYRDYYPVTAVVCGLYPIREPDQANLAPMKVGRLCCMAERGIGHFEVALRVQRLTDIKRTKIQEWKARVHDHVPTVDDASFLAKDIAAEDINNSGKYQQ